MGVAAEEFLIKLQQQVSGPAGQAQGALAKLEAQIRKEQAAIAGLESNLDAAKAALEALPKNTSADVVAKALAKVQEARAKVEAQQGSLGKLGEAKGLAGEIDAKAAADKRAKDALKGHEAAAKAQAKAAAEQKAAQAESAAVTREALGPLGDMTTMLGSASAAAGAAVGAALALVAAIVAVTVAATAAAVALTAYAFAAADAARASRLLDVGASGGAAKGRELTMVIDQIAAKVPLARAQIEAFGRQLELAGISGRRMQVALETIAAIESVVPGAGAKIEGLVERFQRLRRAVLTRQDLEGTGLALVDVAAQLAKAMGISQQAAIAMLQNGTAGIDKVLDAMKKAVEQKFGKTIAAQMLGLQVQFSKLKENIAGLFAGVDLEPLLVGLKTITDLFSQNTVTGRVLKAILGAVFTNVAAAISKVAPFVVAFFKGFIIGALQMYIVLAPLGRAIKEALGGGDKANALATALQVGAVAAHMLGVGIKVVLTWVLWAIQAIQTLRAAAISIADAVPSIGGIIAAMANLGPMAAAAGVNLVTSFANAILGAIGSAVAAVAQLGAAVEGALRNAIGWHSPATLGVDAAGAIGEGFTQEAGAQENKTSDAAGKMINPKGAKDAAKAGRSSGKIIYIENFYGTDDALLRFRAMLGSEFEYQRGS